jgi:hypothetical protein
MMMMKGAVGLRAEKIFFIFYFLNLSVGVCNAVQNEC